MDSIGVQSVEVGRMLTLEWLEALPLILRDDEIHAVVTPSRFKR
jgi:hypothetical protein